jgi:hypothetical protein
VATVLGATLGIPLQAGAARPDQPVTPRSGIFPKSPEHNSDLLGGYLQSFLTATLAATQADDLPNDSALRIGEMTAETVSARIERGRRPKVREGRPFDGQRGVG